MSDEKFIVNICGIILGMSLKICKHYFVLMYKYIRRMY